MRQLLWILAALVLVYSIGLLWHVATDPQPGIHCLLRGATNEGPRIAVNEALEFIGGRPHTGDWIVAIAGDPVPTFTHFHRKLKEISDREWTESILGPRDSETGLQASWPPVLDSRGGHRWVRIDFKSDHLTTSTAWVPLKPPAASAMLISWAWFGLELLIFAIGAIVVWRRPGDGSAVLFYVLCAVQVVMFLGAFYWPSLVDTRWLIYPFLFCTVVQVPLMLHFHLLFPRPVSVLRRWPRSTLAVVYGVPAVWIVMMFAFLFRLTWLFESGAAPAEITGLLRNFTVIMYAYLILSLVMFLGSQALLVRSFLRSRTLAERNQVKWLLASMFVVVWPVGYLLYTSTWQPDEFVFGWRSKVMLYATSAVFALGYAVSITRYKLRQASRIVDRGLIYVAISFGATALFCGLVGLGTMLVGRYYFSWENAAAAGVTAMLVVVLLGWLRDRFQRALDRRFHQHKYKLDKAMSRLSEAVDQLVDPAQLARQLLQSAREAVRADRGAVYLQDSAGRRYELVAWTGWSSAPQRELDNTDAAEFVLASGSAGANSEEWGLRSLDAALAISLELDGDTVGLMVLGPKEDGTPYSPEDRGFLAALVQTAALALRSARGHRTIEALRQELQSKVEKVAEQQQRIHYLQSQLLNRSDARTASTPSASSTNPLSVEPEPTRHVTHGSSAALASLLREAAKVARSNSSVLIRGESGTGKELLAQTIHTQSPRAKGPFVAVHCAALSAGLLESELFGHVRGAFTGADRDKTGRFELANKGTLFLDEIGDINAETQTKLLRVLQERSFERVGGARTIAVDVRLIAATHQNLEALMQAGRFREDLYYRLNVISLRCPALRERREDIFELALHFLKRYAAEAGKEIVRIEEETLEALLACAWPGNIRQLENAIQRAVVLAEGESLRRTDLPPEILASVFEPTQTPPDADRLRTRKQRAAATAGRERGALAVLDQELANVERSRLEEAIVRADGNKAAAARLLGLPRSTFFSKLRKFGLD